MAPIHQQLATTPSSVAEYEQLASERVPSAIFRFYQSGSDQKFTLDRNRSAFNRILLQSELLAEDVSSIDTTTRLLGGRHILSMPICVSPSALHKFINDNGEVATAIGCKKAGTLMTLSTWANCSPMEVAGSDLRDRWMNVYMFDDWSTTTRLVDEAKKWGYGAIVISCDIPTLGLRRDFAADDWIASARNISMTSAANFPGDVRQQSSYHHGSPSTLWSDFSRIVASNPTMPVIAKGIANGLDAERAIASGAAAVWVSNHGGRAMDGQPASIEMLSEVVAAVRGRCDVYIDGGFRLGKDVFKALALGAKAVFVGRPALYGLAVNGADGVADVLNIMNDELKSYMTFAGCANVERIKMSRLIFTRDWLRSQL